MNNRADLKHCSTDRDFDQAKIITNKYVDWIDLDLSFQGIEDEMEKFSTMYGPPDGLFVLAYVDGALAGGVGLRKLESQICEMKRLFVYDDYKGMQIGKIMCQEIIMHSRDRGYLKMRLDTLASMTSAQRLYQQLGFREIEAYRYNPDPEAIYMELNL